MLVLNAGSSSLKFSIFELGVKLRSSAASHGAVTGFPHEPHVRITGGDGAVLEERDLDRIAGHEAALRYVLDWVDRAAAKRIVAAGHRVVHGGAVFTEPCVVDDKVIEKLRELVPMAPLHQPHNIAAIVAFLALHPGVPQVACFDTAFHHAQPPIATRFALPASPMLTDVKRYGFHGLSYEYVASVLPSHLGERAEGRVIVAHLGSGASMCALQFRRSVATTMGFTALDGLVMGTRCGALDPGVLLYLLERGMSATELRDLLWERSGLLGVSGISDDVRELLAADTAPAREAIELFVYRIARETGSLAAALGGLDAFVFTAGIGENAPAIRAAVCERLGWLGIALDAAANAAGGPQISQAGAAARVLVVGTDEEVVIARHTARLLGLGSERS